MDAPEVIRWASGVFGKRLCFATSLGAEDQVITHFIAEVAADTRMFTLDTGRLFPESYELIDKTEARYARRVEVFAPQTEEVESMVSEHGSTCFTRMWRIVNSVAQSGKSPLIALVQSTPGLWP
jgi:phosphoadenosine phosphosulfate reductase